MVNFCAVCDCCTRTDIVREHLEDTLRICDVSAMSLCNSCMHNNCNCIYRFLSPNVFPMCIRINNVAHRDSAMLFVKRIPFNIR